MWIGFSTRKTFSWKDQYRTSDAPDRATRRLIEKENKKFRDAGIREYNEAVVALITFVRRRDPRYLPNSQTDADRQKILRDAAANQAKRARAANQARLNQHAVPDWAKTAARDPEEGEFEEEEEDVVEHIECVACGKVFKSERQYEAHERSKKHIQSVKHMQREMRKENKRLGLPEELPEDTPAESFEKLEIEEDGSSEIEREMSANDDKSTLENVSTKKQIGETVALSPQSSADSSDLDDEYAPREKVEARIGSLVEGEIPINQQSTGIPTPMASIASDNEIESLGQAKIGKAKLKKAKKAARQQTEEGSEGTSDIKCAACSNAFPSKTKLFNHIKDNPTHAQPVAKPGKGKKRR